MDLLKTIGLSDSIPDKPKKKKNKTTYIVLVGEKAYVASKTSRDGVLKAKKKRRRYYY